MNPLVSEMLSAQAGQDVELRFLEDLMNDDCKCESIHRNFPGETCSEKVTHIFKGHRISKRICSVAVRRILAGNYNCEDCGRHIRDCWEIRPI